jgi:hypothetical protein
MRQPITVQLAADQIGAYFSQQRAKVSPRLIAEVVARRLEMDLSLVLGASRRRTVVLARQISMYLGNKFYPLITWADLAKPFNKDHATAMTSVKAINNLIETNKQFREKITKYSNTIHLSIAGNAEIVEVEELTEHVGFINTNLGSLVLKMRIIALAYCELTNQKIISNENQN